MRAEAVEFYYEEKGQRLERKEERKATRKGVERRWLQQNHRLWLECLAVQPFVFLVSRHH